MKVSRIPASLMYALRDGSSLSQWRYGVKGSSKTATRLKAGPKLAPVALILSRPVSIADFRLLPGDLRVARRGA